MINENNKIQIKKYIDEKSKRIFSNSNKELFESLLHVVFQKASDIQWLNASFEKLNFFFQDEGIILIENFLQNKNNTLKLIIPENINSISKKLENLSKKYNNFTFKEIKNTSKKYQDMLIWDDIGYRFAPDPKKLIGVACANDMEFTLRCKTVISKLLLTD